MRLLSTGFAAYVQLLAYERRSGRLLALSGGRAVNEGGVGAAGARTAPDIHENQEALSVAKRGKLCVETRRAARAQI